MMKYKDAEQKALQIFTPGLSILDPEFRQTGICRAHRRIHWCSNYDSKALTKNIHDPSKVFDDWKVIELEKGDCPEHYMKRLYAHRLGQKYDAKRLEEIKRKLKEINVENNPKEYASLQHDLEEMGLINNVIAQIRSLPCGWSIFVQGDCNNEGEQPLADISTKAMSKYYRGLSYIGATPLECAENALAGARAHNALKLKKQACLSCCSPFDLDECNNGSCGYRPRG